MILIRTVSSVSRSSKFCLIMPRREGKTLKQVATGIEFKTQKLGNSRLLISLFISGELALKKTGSTKSLPAGKETKSDQTLEDLSSTLSKLTLSRRSPHSCRRLDPAEGKSGPAPPPTIREPTSVGTKSRSSATSRSLKHK